MSSKGKQGTKGQKQIYEENLETLKFYYIMAAVGILLHLIVNYLLSATKSAWLLFVTSILVEFGAFYLMRRIARPIKNETGHLVDAGLDLNLPGGVSEYAKDVIILSTVIQLLSVFSIYFWLLYLLLPGYAMIWLWKNILGPWFFAPGNESDEKDDKKRRKKEKKLAIRR